MFGVLFTHETLTKTWYFSDIIECAGGQFLKSMPKIARDDTFVISCAEDKATVATARKKNIKLMNIEILLTGLLKWELDFKANVLHSE
jgi:hypothetical protein